ncbi:hypothetical protein Dimus_031641 [Dionaea muscipula]
MEGQAVNDEGSGGRWRPSLLVVEQQATTGWWWNRGSRFGQKREREGELKIKMIKVVYVWFEGKQAWVWD